jgi:hypothetical protein
MLVKEAILECVIMGSILDEALPSYCCVDSDDVDISSGSLGDCEQLVDSPYDVDWKPVASKKKIRRKVIALLKRQRDLRKELSPP